MGCQEKVKVTSRTHCPYKARAKTQKNLMNTIRPQGCLQPNVNTFIPTRENAHVNQSFGLFCVICKMHPEWEVMAQNNMRQQIISN